MAKTQNPNGLTAEAAARARNGVRGYRTGPRWPAVLRELAGLLKRELRLAFTPIVTPQKWVFVVGCYNSGTELLASLIGSHVSVSALPTEGQFLTDQFFADYELGLPRMWALREELFRLNETQTGPDVTRLKKEWLMRLDRTRPLFLEKSPPNAARMRWLQKHFENAHFIGLVRNGYAVAEGIRRKAEPYHLRDGWPLELCARQWNRSYEVMLQDSEHLQHITWVRYEDLASDPVGELKRITDFLGIEPFHPDLQGNWQIHERRDPIRDMNEESFRRLSADELRIVTAEAEHMLLHFGYELRP